MSVWVGDYVLMGFGARTTTAYRYVAAYLPEGNVCC